MRAKKVTPIYAKPDEYIKVIRRHPRRKPQTTYTDGYPYTAPSVTDNAPPGGCTEYFVQSDLF